MPKQKISFLFVLSIIAVTTLATQIKWKAVLTDQKEAQVKGLPGFITYDQVKGSPYSVTYDKRSVMIEGQRTIFLSGSVHPPRVSEGSWSNIIQLAKQNGLNMIQVYVFWNYHQPVESVYNWAGNADLRKFVELCAQNDMFVNLRIGPYVCAEWNYGGIPAWLGLKQGIAFRTYNPLWTYYMGNWIKTVIKQLDGLFAPQGGPIVLAQIENEYYGENDPDNAAYVKWCGQVVDEVNIGIPWVMCNGASASNTINVCNANDCTQFIEMHGQNGRVLIDQPAMWTENEGGFQVWGGSPSNPTSYFWGRSSPDTSGAVARWFARGGSHMNYYMYYGGNHYGPWSGSGITNMYASDVNICPDGLPHEPKFSHLQRLHNALAKYSNIILSNDAQMDKRIHLPWYNPATKKFENGTQQLAFVYKGSTDTLIFIENDASIGLLTQYKGRNITINAYTTQLYDGNFNLIFDSSVVQAASTKRQTTTLINSPFTWKSWSEPVIPPESIPYAEYASPIEQISASFSVYPTDPTLTQTPFIWYETTATFASSGTLTISTTKSMSFVAFVNGVQVSQATIENREHAAGDITLTLNLPAFGPKPVKLTLLAENFGNDNGMDPKSVGKTKGITGTVTWTSGSQKVDLSRNGWKSRPALIGEIYEVYSDGASKVNWAPASRSVPAGTWLQTTFQLPPNTQPSIQSSILFSPIGLGRGFMYINGHNIGRYYTIPMNDGSSRLTQKYYHIPWDWLNLTGDNTLTLVEVLGASDITTPRLMTSSMVPSNGLVFDDGGIQTCDL